MEKKRKLDNHDEEEEENYEDEEVLLNSSSSDLTTTTTTTTKYQCTSIKWKHKIIEGKFRVRFNYQVDESDIFHLYNSDKDIMKMYEITTEYRTPGNIWLLKPASVSINAPLDKIDQQAAILQRWASISKKIVDNQETLGNGSRKLRILGYSEKAGQLYERKRLLFVQHP